jgi:PEGA domain
MKAMKALAALACCAIVGLHAVPARANTATEARFFDDEARAQYARGRFEAALAAFLLVHELTPSAGSLYNVAVCAELADDPALAFAFLEGYLRSPDDDRARRVDAQRRYDGLQARLALVEVVTRPAGAEVYVDRPALGSYGTAPRKVAAEPGRRSILASLPGFHGARAEVTVERGKLARVELVLEPVLGELELQVTPPGARLSAERAGVPVPLTAAEGVLRVQVGRYTLRAEAPGHQPAELDVTITEHATTRVRLAAQPIPPRTGDLLVDTGQDVARLFIDGKPVAMTPATLRGLIEGRHMVKVIAPGKVPWSAGVEIAQDTPAYLNVTLVDPEAP